METESSSHSTRCHMPAGTYMIEPGRSTTSVASSQKASCGDGSNWPAACCAWHLACCSAARRTAAVCRPHCGVHPRSGTPTADGLSFHRFTPARVARGMQVARVARVARGSAARVDRE